MQSFSCPFKDDDISVHSVLDLITCRSYDKLYA